MKIFKKSTLLIVVLLGVFSFTKLNNPEKTLELADDDILKLLSKQELECRPSSKYLFYVNTSVLKKYRGYSVINADIYLYERVTGKSALLINKEIIAPIQEGVILYNEEVLKGASYKTLENGDKVLDNKDEVSKEFRNIMGYKVIYNSYMNSKNKLVKN